MHTLEQLRSGALAGTRRLDLSCRLTSLPPEVFGLADTLEVLNLSDNRLTSLPHDLPRLHRLKVVFCSGNPFTHLPEVLGDCPALQMVGFKGCQLTHVPGAALPPSLRWLTLTDNAIDQLPPELGQRPALQKLMLAGNRLSALPDSLAGAQRLELIRLAANRLERLPGWLTELPALAWLALSGNPLGWPQDVASGHPAQADRLADALAGGLRPDVQASAAASPAIPAVDWAQLSVGELLGQGASGLIHRVLAADDQPLALKLFKGDVTSDGLPEHELAACLAAGQHPALCTPSAVLAGHPQGLRGLLLPLIPTGHTNLAGPPSLDSCTRDVYPPGWQPDPHSLLRLARQMASAVAHLHAQGVMHGDFYAHNILWDPATGEALLSDFGAATLLPRHDPALAAALRALEVRAFGLWLHELLAHAPASPLCTGWAAVAQACVQPVPAQRPGMAEVAASLAT